ncbi:MAG: hypothetical protein R3C14_47460 [Caldilineaceae bacterium]
MDTHQTATLSSEKIPPTLRPCFQEYNFDQLDPAQHKELIIERVLAYGNRQELSWLFRRYGRELIIQWTLQMGARRLPWRRYNLWCVLLGLPPAQRLRAEDQRIWPH